VVAAPCFRHPPPRGRDIHSQRLCEAGTISASQAELLRTAVQERKNILVAGGTSTGKNNNWSNALWLKWPKTGDRVRSHRGHGVNCNARPPIWWRCAPRTARASLSDLVRSSLRLRPDRIPIGEVRGAEALDLLKAWGTGHPGGVGTIHAGTAIGALRRLEQLIQEAVVTVPRPLIAETINLIAVLTGRGTARRLVELARIEGLDASGKLRPYPSRRFLMRRDTLRASERSFNTSLQVAVGGCRLRRLLAAPAHAAGTNMPWSSPSTRSWIRFKVRLPR